MSDDVQVNLRLPIALKEKIHDAARENNRSLNAELNERLINSFVTMQDNYSTVVDAVVELASRFQTSDRVFDIKERLDFLLEQVQEIPRTPYLTPSLIASKLGYEYASETEKWFKGQAEPSFSQLKQLARFFGCDESWLQFGIGKPFPTKRHSHFGNVVDVMDFFTTPDDSYDKVSEVLFIRNDSAAGEIIIVKVFDSYRCQVYQTSVHLSDVVGATGTHYRAVLTLVLEGFYRSQWKMKVRSYLVNPDMYDTLISGQQNALRTLARYQFSTWMDDIWDRSMYLKDTIDYWTGWRSLCISIAMTIEQDKRMASDKEMLANRSHEALTLLNDRYYQYFDG